MPISRNGPPRGECVKQSVKFGDQEVTDERHTRRMTY